MSRIEEVLEYLGSAGISIDAVAGKLRCRVPVGALTPQLQHLLHRHRVALYQYLSNGSGSEAPHTSGATDGHYCLPDNWIDAVNAWLRAGCPYGDPIETGMVLGESGKVQ